MTTEYRVKNGTTLFEKMWWNHNWGKEAFKEIENQEVYAEFGINKDDVALLRTRIVIKPNSEAYEKYSESLLKRTNKNGFYEFRRNPKSKEAKRLIEKISDIVTPFYEKNDSFLHMSVFGMGGMRSGFITDDIIAVSISGESSENNEYLDQLEKLTKPEYYKLKAEAYERTETNE